MKKKLVVLALTAVTAASTIIGCSSGTTYGKYVKLGEYKGLEISKIKTEVSEEDIEYEIEMLLEENSENKVVNRGAIEGDELNIDFDCTIDGEHSEDYSDTDYDLILGSGDYDEAFEAQLIGAKAGDVVEISQVFDEEYEEELVGKTAAYTVTVNSVTEINIPEFTDEYCKKYTEYATTEECREAIRADLEAYYEDSNTYTAGTDALTQVIATSEFDRYPDELYDACKSEYDASNKMMAEMFGMSIKEFTSGEDSAAAIEELVNTKMVVYEIAELEDIEVTDEEYTAYVENAYEDYGYASIEEYQADYTKESTMYEILYEEVCDFLLANGNVTEVTEDEYYGDYEDESESEWLDESDWIDETEE